ncbi:MAG TPA: flagellar biosynthesis protein FliQ [Pirellulales bacterium]|jgi:flagellar biosynthetic protein FliQ|nr:flagellar biosynthesis protein FliQ [Pirellulales bacterium]
MNSKDSVDFIVELMRQAMVTTLWLAAPALVAGMVVGLLIGLLQAVTQIQEQAVAFVPKLIITVLVLALTLPWLIGQMLQYSHDLITSIPGNL